MIALAYLATVVVALVVLVVAVGRHRAPATPPPALPAAAGLPPGAEADIRLILATAAQLAARLTPAA